MSNSASQQRATILFAAAVSVLTGIGIVADGYSLAETKREEIGPTFGKDSARSQAAK